MPVEGHLSKIRYAAGIAAFSAGLVLLAPPSQAGNCLYPDKKTGNPPTFSCLKPSERALIDLRHFRADITVAALRCGQQQAYNTFVSRHNKELVAQGKALGKTFRRLHGAAGASELNRYVTHLTNKASIRSLGVRNYCGVMARRFTDMLKLPVAGLVAYVRGNFTVTDRPEEVAQNDATLTAAAQKKSK